MSCPQALVLNNIGGGIGVKVEKLPAVNESVMIKAMEPPGEDVAKGGNVAVAMSRLGIHCAIIGKIGLDEAGDRDYGWMKAAGVDLSVLIRTHEVRTGQGIGITADNGDVMIFTGLSSSRALTFEEVQEALNRYKDAQYFLTGFEVRPSLVLPAARMAKALGMKTVLNPSPIPSGGLEEIPYIDYLFVNEIEACRLLDMEVVRDFDQLKVCAELKRRYQCPNVVVTIGDKGSCYLDEADDFQFIPPVPVTCVDSAGAGDGYMACVISKLIQGETLLQACRYASGFAAYSVTKVDCLPGYPTPDVLDAFIREHT